MPYQCNFETIKVTLFKIKMPHQANNVIALNSSQINSYDKKWNCQFQTKLKKIDMRKYICVILINDRALNVLIKSRFISVFSSTFRLLSIKNRNKFIVTVYACMFVNETVFLIHDFKCTLTLLTLWYHFALINGFLFPFP